MTGWRLTFSGFDPEAQGLREALSATGNGYFVTRGAPTFARADGVHYPATYLAGGYNRLTSDVGGREVENEDLVNLPNWLPLVIRLDDGSWLEAGELDILEQVHELDLQEGILHRRLRISDRRGRILQWRERRFVSMACHHLAAVELRLTPENWSGRLSVRSAIDGTVTNDGVARYRKLASRHHEPVEPRTIGGDIILLRSRFVTSRQEMVMAARTRITRHALGAKIESAFETREAEIAQVVSLPVGAGEEVAIEKIAALYTSRDNAIAEPGLAAVADLEQMRGFEDMARAHRLAWTHLWNVFNLEISTSIDHDADMKLRLSIFHLLQTSSPHSVDLDVGVPARGWHGEAYRGHIFWDELFIFPFINLRMPVITRALLLYRYRRLPEARRAARRAGCAGAMFPWQSGSDGREETQLLHLNPLSQRWLPDVSHRQRHVNAAILFNIWHYFQVTEDYEFLSVYGAELMIEITRFWTTLAQYDTARGRYSIQGVIGPDEFHTAPPGKSPEEACGIANNAYTNILVAWGIARTLDVIDMLPVAERTRLCEALDISQSEIEHWHDVSRKLFVPFHGDGIISQFEGYEDLEELDWRHYRAQHANVQRLDRILEAEGSNPNRYKISKQADVLMLLFLFSMEELKDIFDQLGYEFSPEVIARNIEYYTARTSHGSTLSWVVHAWVLSRRDRLGSWRLFERALNSDFHDLQGGTTAEGIHLGAMAGTVDIIQRCYTGAEVRANMLSFNPLLPEELECLRTTYHYRGHTLDVTITRDTLEVASRTCSAAPILISYRNHIRRMSPGQTFRFRLLHPRATALHQPLADPATTKGDAR
jgi:alpha,alpha-trehalase